MKHHGVLSCRVLLKRHLRCRFVVVMLVLGMVGCQTPAPLAKESPIPRYTPVPTTSASPAPRLESPTPTITLPTPRPAVSPRPSQVVSPPTRPNPVSRFPLTLPGPAKLLNENDPKLKAFTEQARVSRMATDWRKAGEQAQELKLYSQAAKAFRQEAGIYRSKGLLQAALAQEARAEQVSTELGIYLEGSVANRAGLKLERLEPASGCLLGAFIDRDDKLRSFMMNSQTHGDVDDFNRLTGKSHASFFMYRGYGQPFPTEWARYLKARGAIVHLAWEPQDLAKVQDDAYLKGFVDAMVALDHPVMLRFASEMNGKWTPYHGDPKRYRDAFRMIHRATRRAPKVALMWCPNTIPQEGMNEYYPGDEYVDWVGVNFYSVPFLDNDRGRPGVRIHPTDHLKAVYDRYAGRKPIAIGEWAASHQSSASPEPMVEFAKTKISQLYATLPLRYPRVKMVNWYSSNNLRHATPARQLNNYQVTDPPELVKHYSAAVSSSHYLSSFTETKLPTGFRPVFGRTALEGGAELRLALKSYEPKPKVYFKVNGQIVVATDEPLDWRLSGDSWKAGKNVLEVFVFDRQNRFVTREKLVLDL